MKEYQRKETNKLGLFAASTLIPIVLGGVELVVRNLSGGQHLEFLISPVIEGGLVGCFSLMLAATYNISGKYNHDVNDCMSIAYGSLVGTGIIEYCSRYLL